MVGSMRILRHRRTRLTDGADFIGYCCAGPIMVDKTDQTPQNFVSSLALFMAPRLNNFHLSEVDGKDGVRSTTRIVHISRSCCPEN